MPLDLSSPYSIRPHGGYKVAVVGGRTFDNKEWLYSVLDEYHRRFYIELIISGGAKGADTLGERWAKDNQIDHLIYMAQWSLYGKEAGKARNTSIVKAAEVIIAFPTIDSRGTYDTIEKGKLYQKLVYVFGPEKEDFKKYEP